MGIWKDERHDHFWIEGGVLHESYSTIRGLRWRERRDVDARGFADSDRVTDDVMANLEELNSILKSAESGETTQL